MTLIAGNHALGLGTNDIGWPSGLMKKPFTHCIYTVDTRSLGNGCVPESDPCGSMAIWMCRLVSRL